MHAAHLLPCCVAVVLHTNICQIKLVAVCQCSEETKTQPVIVSTVSIAQHQSTITTAIRCFTGINVDLRCMDAYAVLSVNK